jgi:hypothetical protein
VDLFAERGKEKIAVQAKMYGSSRPINREMVMHLKGAEAYFDCTGSAIITDGRVKEDAAQVAQKLGVQLIYLKSTTSLEPKLDQPVRLVQRDVASNLDFDTIWERHIMPLKGLVITSPDGLENTIVNVDASGVTRITSKNRQNRLPIEVFRSAIAHLLRHGSITREQINEDYVKRGSSGVVLILSQVPLFEYVSAPKNGLRLRRD